VAVRRVTAIAGLLAAAVALVMVVTGFGTGRGALSALWLILVAAGIVVMGILARVSAGSAVPWLFYFSAIGGGLVGRGTERASHRGVAARSGGQRSPEKDRRIVVPARE
jgi:hypothetical protein